MVYLIFHLFGVAVGAGSAYMSDLIFIHSARDGKISPTEHTFLRLASRMVWVGLFILILSGIGLYFEHPERYAESGKFWAKMTIVGVIILNGIIFHTYHIPHLKRNPGEHLLFSEVFSRRGPLLLVSGAVSFVSWTSALILGAINRIPFTYLEIMLTYGFIVLGASIFAYALRKQILGAVDVLSKK
ncbi:MAG: hypothetical protein Q8P35_02165 [Candidatus Yanofskybacteria bacterium]|nr:hypothetical protein [Candidatus Yanofskybacteria bacterium]